MPGLGSLPPMTAGTESADELISMITCGGRHEFQDQLRKLCYEFADIFSLGLRREPAKVRPFKVQVDRTKWEEPVNRRSPRPQGYAKEEEIRRQVDKLIKERVIRESNARYYSQVVMAKKPDGVSWRLCVDYRHLNDASEAESWPLPIVSRVMERLGKKQPTIFGKMDLTSGFWQAPISQEASVLTAFITSFGLFEFKRLPMGAKGAPSWFNRVISRDVLKELLYEICELYIDDVIAHAKTEEEFLQRMRLIFTRFRECKILLNPKKVQLGITEIEFLGHMVSK